ncbi:MAG: hypothetical protein JWL95_1684 [Gemmatimonadetes bacterium]|nr:hypothetical protein [Gemmatimonadota bacterium]
MRILKTTLAAALSIHLLGASAALLSSMLMPRVARAQAPWTMTLTPTMDPLPIGSCGAVWLSVKDSTGADAPRNAAGNRVTIADFDLSVASANPVAVAGAYNGASSWSVCGCQGAKAGSSATITARYPSPKLAPASRVRGMAFSKTVSFKLRRRMGNSEPPACAELKAARASAAGRAKRS